MLTDQLEMTQENKNKIIEKLENELNTLNKYKNKGVMPRENKKLNLFKSAYQSAVMITKEIVD